MALVVAHPDDEILWFSSILRRAASVIVCFLNVPERADWTDGRRRVAQAYPLPGATFLGLTESVVFAGADWSAPVVSEYGLDVQKRRGTLPGFDADLYRSNYHTLVARLREALAGVDTVVTHNPWGEYGHEEHVQVHRAVTAVQKVHGFDVWFSNYCSERSYALMAKEIEGLHAQYAMVPTDVPLAREIEALYRRNDCWTWPFDDYAYFEHECLIRRDPTQTVQKGAMWPLNFIRLGDAPPPQRRPVSNAPPFVRFAKHQLRKLIPGTDQPR